MQRECIPLIDTLFWGVACCSSGAASSFQESRQWDFLRGEGGDVCSHAVPAAAVRVLQQHVSPLRREVFVRVVLASEQGGNLGNAISSFDFSGNWGISQHREMSLMRGMDITNAPAY